jgi:hypothetical protein
MRLRAGVMTCEGWPHSRAWRFGNALFGRDEAGVSPVILDFFGRFAAFDFWAVKGVRKQPLSRMGVAGTRSS